MRDRYNLNTLPLGMDQDMADCGKTSYHLSPTLFLFLSLSLSLTSINFKF